MEFLDVVDEQDHVVGRASKKEIYERLLPHRIVHVLVFNNSGELALQLRGRNSFLPHHWCTTAGGHVQSGETYEEAARRELREEAGLVPDSLTFLRKDLYVDNIHHKNLRKFLTTFIVSHNGPLRADGTEVDRIEFFTLDKIHEMIAEEKFHPELLMILREQYGIQ